MTCVTSCDELGVRKGRSIIELRSSHTKKFSRGHLCDPLPSTLGGCLNRTGVTGLLETLMDPMSRLAVFVSLLMRTIMDQNSNVNLQVVQGDFPIKYGPKTLKHPWSIS